MLNNKILINRFGTYLLEQMSGCIIHFEERPNIDKFIASFFTPPDKYIPTKEGEFILKFANGPTPCQINNHILREQCDGPLVPTRKEVYFRDEVSIYLKQFRNIYEHIFKEMNLKSLRNYEKKLRRLWEKNFISVTKKFNRHVIKEEYKKNVELLEILHVKKKQKIYDDLEKEKPLEMARVGHLEERKNFLSLFSAYKSQFDADNNEMSTIPLTEKMGKEAQKLIVKLYSVPYRHLQNISFKIRSGTHAIENCGYDKLFDSDKWLEETLDKESNDLAYLMCQIDDDKLDLTAINSVIEENVAKFDMWSQVLRDLLEEFQVIVSHVMDKEPQFAQYLPTFEKFFKTRAAWYIMNVRKELTENAMELREIDNKLITSKVDERMFGSAGQEKLKKPNQIVFKNAFVQKTGKKVDPWYEADIFSSYIEEIIFAMKKLPDLWKSYVEYL
ncbi:uncharacterized protein isoform X2 [Rhodnius prolixus]